MSRPKLPDQQQPSPHGKLSTSHRLAVDTLQRIDRLAAELNVPKGAVIDLAVRLLAKHEGVA